MKTASQRQVGVTLLETLLALAIISAILLLSINQYQSFRNDSNALGVQYNIDTLYQSALGYYHGNCRNGTLDPQTNPTILTLTTPSYPISVTTDLITAGYLTSPAQLNPIVNSTKTWDGYMVQYNVLTAPRMMTVCNDPACTTTSYQQIGTTFFWQIQVAMKLNDVSKAQTYMQVLGASCVSSVGSNNFVAPCGESVAFGAVCPLYRQMAAELAFSSPPLSAEYTTMANGMNCGTSANASDYNNYLVFARLPSGAVTGNTPSSDLWTTNPSVDEFNNMYTTDPLTTLTTTPHTPTEYQYFKCGG